MSRYLQARDIAKAKKSHPSTALWRDNASPNMVAAEDALTYLRPVCDRLRMLRDNGAGAINGEPLALLYTADVMAKIGRAMRALSAGVGRDSLVAELSRIETRGAERDTPEHRDAVLALIIYDAIEQTERDYRDGRLPPAALFEK